jgi:hypothetical protein
MGEVSESRESSNMQHLQEFGLINLRIWDKIAKKKMLMMENTNAHIPIAELPAILTTTCCGALFGPSLISKTSSLKFLRIHYNANRHLL